MKALIMHAVLTAIVAKSPARAAFERTSGFRLSGPDTRGDLGRMLWRDRSQTFLISSLMQQLSCASSVDFAKAS